MAESSPSAVDVLAMAKANMGIFEDIVWVIADAGSEALGFSSDVGRHVMAIFLTGLVVLIARFLFQASWEQADEHDRDVNVSAANDAIRHDPLSPKPLKSLGGHMARIRSRIIKGDATNPATRAGRNYKKLSSQIDQTMYAARKRYHELMSTFGMRAAVNKYNERIMYNRVTKNSQKGDGLTSLFTTVPAPSHADLKKLSVSPSSQAFGQFHQFPHNGDALEALHATEIFSWLPERNLRTLANRAVKLTYKEGDVIFEKGTKVKSPCCFVVVSGKVGLVLDVDASGAATNYDPVVASKGSQNSIPLLNGRSTPISTSTHETGHDMVTFSSGEMVTGLTDLVGTIMEQPLTTLARAVVLEQGTLIVKISKSALDALFLENTMVKQHLLQRILIRINRVSFMSLFRLTGRFVLETPLYKSMNDDGQEPSLADSICRQTPGPETPIHLAMSALAKELGIPREELQNNLEIAEWEWEQEEGSTPTNESIDPTDSIRSTDDEPLSNPLISTPRSRASSATRSSSIDVSGFTQGMQDKLQATVKEHEDGLKTKSKHVAQLVVLNNGDDILQVSVEPAMYIVISGRLDVYVGTPGDPENSVLEHSIYPSQALGHLSLLSGCWSEWYAYRKSNDKTSEYDSPSQVWVAAGGADEVEVTSSASTSRFDELGGSSSYRSFNGLASKLASSQKARSGSFGSTSSLRPWCKTTTTTLLRVPQQVYFALVRMYPEIVSRKARNMLRELSPLVRLMDATTKWVRLQPGDTLLKQGQRSDKLHVVLHGRMRSTVVPVTAKRPSPRRDSSASHDSKNANRQTSNRLFKGASMYSTSSDNGWGWSYAPSDAGIPESTDSHTSHGYTDDEELLEGKEETIEEFGKGATMGQLAFLTGKGMTVNLRAVRSTQIASIPRAAVMAVVTHHPELLLRLSKELATRSQVKNGSGMRNTALEGRTVAMVPASPTVPLDLFAYTLAAAMDSMGTSVFIVTSAKVEQVAAKRILSLTVPCSDDEQSQTSDDQDLVISTWLSELEDKYDVVLYQADPWADPEPSRWTQLCVMEADTVLLVGNSADSPRCSALELKLSKTYTNAQRELVLLHINPSDQGARENIMPLPTKTRAWIENRGNINHHHHIRFHPYDKSPFQGRTQGLYDVHHFKSDFRRLGRWLTGTSVGLVLGGGGAKGCAHIGVLRALENQGIPVDFVGGTSIGAFMGGLYCVKTDQLLMRQVVAKFCHEMSSIWKKLRDITLPLTAYFTGKGFNRTIVKVFENQKIEDSWIPFVCVTTDLTDSKELAHRNGAMWRYIRASMSLTGYLPPVCDVVETEDGGKQVHYICDGGYVNNLPVDIIRDLVGPDGTVIAVDVQAEWHFSGDDYGDSLNGWKTLFTWLNPWSEARKVPSANDIQVQLAYISSVKQSQISPPQKLANLLINPPVGHYGTLEFGKHKEIEALGYEAAVQSINEWKQSLKEGLDGRLRMWATSKVKDTSLEAHEALKPSKVFAALDEPIPLLRSSSMTG